MNSIEEIKSFVRAQLGSACVPVPPKTSTSRSVHLFVWETRQKRRPIGVEFDHKDMINFWLCAIDLPSDLPPSISHTKKVWKAGAWTDENGEGANSNLKSYDAFRTNNLVRLGVLAMRDARLLIEKLPA